MEPAREFEATVDDVREQRRVGARVLWEIALNRTEFGADETGVLMAVARSGVRLVVPVLQVLVDAGGTVWHVVEKPLGAGTRVTGWVHRATG